MKTSEKKPSIYFIVATPLGILPSQRFRFEHYLPYLDENGVKYKISHYFSMKTRDVLYKKANVWGKVMAIMPGYLKRFGDLFRLIPYNYVYIHREVAPVGPPVFEWIIAKILRKKIVYDFDDAIWVPTMSEHNKKFRFTRSFSKIGKICKWSYVVTVGNKFLADYASQFSKKNVQVIPTVVNTETTHGQLQEQGISKPAIGWTGSFTTLVYLNKVLPVLQRLQNKIDFTFYVIADQDPALPLKNYQFIKWKRDTETEDLLRFHIGLMPLTDDVISRGKCGFKAIQYMALGIPPVVSPVGVNTEIVQDGVNGYICEGENEWEERLEKLLTDENLRKNIGIAARRKIEQQYSVYSTRDMFLDVFKKK
ncbi:MAG TPA: glycosyltransferase [Chitinophagaceae bacterium]